jgi:hypothetical protein
MGLFVLGVGYEKRGHQEAAFFVVQWLCYQELHITNRLFQQSLLVQVAVLWRYTDQSSTWELSFCLDMVCQNRSA